MQLSTEIENDPGTRLPLDYDVAIFFQKPTSNFTHGDILTKVENRLLLTEIELGSNMVELVYIPCRELI